DEYNALRELDRLFDGGLQSFLDVLLNQEAIHHDLNRMVFLLIEFEGLIEVVKNAVNPAAHIASLRQGLKLFLEFAFAAAHDGRQNHHPLAIGKRFQMPYDLI